MRRNFGQIRRGTATYFVYESAERIVSGGAFALPAQIPDPRHRELMVDSVGGSRTTLVKANAYRLDKQNSSLVTFDNHANAYDNFSIQTGSDSIAVLYIEDGFIQSYTNGAVAIGTDVAGLRGVFAAVRNGTAGDGDLLLLRVLYTWLAVSNKVGYKLCISSKVKAIAAPPVPALAGDPSAAVKEQAKANI